MQTFQQVLELERKALDAVCDRLNSQPEEVEAACRILAGKPSDIGRRVVVSGVGKAGLIARKVAATLNSTGTGAAFIHPVEGLHGDMGFVQSGDAALLFSHSGETVEIVRLARHLRTLNCALIAVTRSRQNSLSGLVDVCIATGDVEEACYLGLAPTSSTTVMLAIGDALALSVARSRGFREEDFARNHPAGSLGLRFALVESEMRTGNRLVCVSPLAPIRQVVEWVTRAKTGAAVLVNADATLFGIFTDGDLRRAILKGEDVLDQPVQRYGSHPCHSLPQGSSLAEAINMFTQTRTEDLPIVDREDGRVVGMLCLKDLPTF